jgi:hypothetical protein
MDAFLKTNPGLSSRFDRILKFDDYSSEELFEIMVLMVQNEDLIIEEAALEYMKKYCAFMHFYRDRYFGNARSVRQAVVEMIKKHHLRMANTESEERNLGTITLDDAKTLSIEKTNSIFEKKGISF